MALGTPTNLLTSGSGTDASSYTSASVSPSANAVLVLFVPSAHATAGAPPTSIAGSLGLTWNFIGEDTGSAGSLNGAWYWTATGGSPPSGTIQINFPSARASCSWHVTQILGADLTNPIVQWASGSNTTLDNPSVTLAALQPGSLTIGGCIWNSTNVVPVGSGYTSLSDAPSQTSPAQRSSMEYKNPGSTTVGWTLTQNLVKVYFGLEIREASLAANAGSGTGTFTFAGAASGTKAPRGTGAGTFTFAGTAVGAKAPIGTGAGVFSYIGRTITYLDLPATGLKSFHRAGGGALSPPFAPENSRSGVMAAIAAGADIVDLDCRFTADGIAVAMHDATTGRTCPTDVTVLTTNYASLPQIHKPSLYGSGWAAEPIPKIGDLLDEFGSQVCFTIEVKDDPLNRLDEVAALIHARGLENSVFINGQSAATTTEIVANGILAHQWGVTSDLGVNNAAAAGATIIELPHNVSSGIMANALSSGFFRVISAPLNTRAEKAAMTAGFHGYVDDGPLYVERTTARSTNISEMITTGQRAPGTFIAATGGSLLDWLSPGAFKWRSGDDYKFFMLGDVSGPPASSGTITMSFKYTTLPSLAGESIRFRLMAPEEGVTGGDTDTRGYVIGLRANGSLNLWESVSGYGSATALGTSTGSNLTVNTEYTMTFEWTSTQVRLTLVNDGRTTGWVNSSAAAHLRGNYHYIWDTLVAGTTGVGLITGFSTSTGPNSGTADTGAWAFAGTAVGAESPVAVGTGAWAFAGAATGSKAPVGTGSGSWAFAGTAAGVKAPVGAGSGSFAFAGSATGAKSQVGIGVGSFNFASTATGQRAPVGSGAGTLAFSGTASGAVTRSGSGAGAWSFAGTAAGSRVLVGTGAGTWTFTSAAAGSRISQGAGSGTLAYVGGAVGDGMRGGAANGLTVYLGNAAGTTSRSGSATGIFAFEGAGTSTSQRSGSGSGSFSFSGSAAGAKATVGVGVGTFNFVSAAVGSRAPLGSGSGTLTYVGAAAGVKSQRGTGSGSFSFAGASLGARSPVAAAAGDWAFTGAGSGTRVSVGSGEGTFTFEGTASGGTGQDGFGGGVWTFSGSTTGVRAPVGSGSGAWTFAGAGVGVRLYLGTGSGTWGFVGTAASATAKQGSGSGSFSFTGAATGQQTPVGSGQGETSWDGMASGARISLGSASGTLHFTGGAVGGTMKGGASYGSTVWAGSAVGSVPRGGDAAGDWTFVGNAVGSSPQRGTATGSVQWDGDATGEAARGGSSAGVWHIGGLALGEFHPEAWAAGETVWQGGGVGLADDGDLTPARLQAILRIPRAYVSPVTNDQTGLRTLTAEGELDIAHAVGTLTEES